jgi:hypothetical protein
MEDWKRHLLYLAAKTGMCDPYMAALKECRDKREAVELYKKELNWALSVDYPPFPTIAGEFRGMESEGVFVGHTFSGEVFKRQQCYIFHRCMGEVAVDIDTERSVIPMLYVANGCDLRIRRADTSDRLAIIVPIYVFGENHVVPMEADNIRFHVFRKEME